jgi:hypothetical protein
VEAIAQAPHPIGSAQAQTVQAYLLQRMSALGLSPAARPFASPAGAGRNLLGVLPGVNRDAPAVLLMAHSDSVPAGPGAADDGAGVAAVLETVRGLETAKRYRDVMVLFTDGEEAGLLGAKAFFTNDPARAHVGVVINLEARGDKGRAVMFETNRQAAPLITALIEGNALTGASSLMPDLYRRLPNDTDLSQALAHGYEGLNFAFFAGLDAYHRPNDTAQRLDPASLQHLGEQVLAAAKALAVKRNLPGQAPDQVYADLLGRPVLQYPLAAGWALLGLAALGVAGSALKALQERRATTLGLLGGVGAFLALVLLVAIALMAASLLRGLIAGGHLAPILRQFGQVAAGATLLGAGAAMIWLRVATPVLRPASLAIGAQIAVTLTAAVVQATAPLDAFIFVWPLVLSVVGMILTAPDRRFIGPLFALAACAQVFYWGGQAFALVGQASPWLLTPFGALAAMTLLPLEPRAGRTALALGVAWAAAGLTLCLLALA